MSKFYITFYGWTMFAICWSKLCRYMCMDGWIRRQKVKSSQHQKQNRIKQNKIKKSRLSRKLFIWFHRWLVGRYFFFVKYEESDGESIQQNSQLFYLHKFCSIYQLMKFVALCYISSIRAECLVYRCKYANILLENYSHAKSVKYRVIFSLWAWRFTTEHALNIFVHSKPQLKNSTLTYPVSKYMSFVVKFIGYWFRNFDNSYALMGFHRFWWYFFDESKCVDISDDFHFSTVFLWTQSTKSMKKYALKSNPYVLLCTPLDRWSILVCWSTFLP